MKKKFKISLFWNFFGASLSKLFTLSIAIVLTRILYPEDFGVFAIAMIVISILLELCRFGVESFIVYSKSNDDKLIPSAFSFLMLLAVIFAVVGMLIAPLTAKFYNEPRVIYVLVILSLSFLVYPFYWVPSAMLTKRMDFKSIAFVNIISNFLSALIIITLAVNGAGIISLVLSAFLDKVFGAILFLKYTSLKQNLKFNTHYWKEIINYGKYILGAVICWLIIFNMDNAIVGKLIGVKSLGYYSFAYNLAMMPSMFLGIIFSQVTFPVFSRLRNEEKKLKVFYIKMFFIMLAITIPLFAPMIVFARPLVILTFGSKWLPSVYPFQIILIYSAVRLLFCFCPSASRAIGRTDIEFKLGIAFLPMCIIGFLIASKYGIAGMATAVSAILSLSPIVFFGVCLKIISR